MKVALIGAGGIGLAHHNAYLLMKDEVQIVAVVDQISEQAKKIADQHGANVYSSVDEMFASETPDFVDICVPSFLHPEMTIQCLNKKVHVLCEKPIAYDLESAKAMADAAEENGKFLMIAQVLRFWPEYVYLKQLYNEKRYGKLNHATFSRFCSSPDWGSGWYTDPEKSRMAPFELHNHDTDFIHYMFGKPKAVSSIGMEDYSSVTSLLSTHYHYDDVLVHGDTGWSKTSMPFLMSYRATFERAVVEFKDRKLVVYEHGRDPEEIVLEEEKTVNAGINIKSSGGTYNEIMYFVNCVRSNIPPTVVSPRDSYESLEILLSEIESAKTGKMVYL